MLTVCRYGNGNPAICSGHFVFFSQRQNGTDDNNCICENTAAQHSGWLYTPGHDERNRDMLVILHAMEEGNLCRSLRAAFSFISCRGVA